MTYLVSFDPGKSTGIVLGEYDDATAYVRLRAWQVEGGLAGLLVWLNIYYVGKDGAGNVFVTNEGYIDDPLLVSEKFVLQNNQFVADITPAYIEGAMVALGLEPIWQRAACQVLAGGDTPAERKKNSNQVLKDGGLWLTGKDVACKDANDAISAQKHALWYLKHIGHEPTIRAYWGEE